MVLLNEQTDAGAYACHAKIDATGEHDIHFNVHIKRELNQCSGCTTIVNDMPIAVVAPNSNNQITTKNTPHLKTVTTTVSTASHSMVYGYGVGQSIQKRHIPSTTLSSASLPVMQTNQHMNLYDVELTTQSITTERANVDDTTNIFLSKRSSYRWIQPTRPSPSHSPDPYSPQPRG